MPCRLSFISRKARLSWPVSVTSISATSMRDDKSPLATRDAKPTASSSGPRMARDIICPTTSDTTTASSPKPSMWMRDLTTASSPTALVASEFFSIRSLSAAMLFSSTRKVSMKAGKRACAADGLVSDSSTISSALFR
ncbi:conserved hypothetical protein [Ricinus communis]|uniref:Ig-like domain-containing protein n=1 Tax=Ricinus communis TaxID=3988 RepID=B9TMA9_RICCO|nr:conserved hypothetical protein [Ricinus communis]